MLATATDGAFSLLPSQAAPGDGAPLPVHGDESESLSIRARTYRIWGGDDIVEATTPDFLSLLRGGPARLAWSRARCRLSKLILAGPGTSEDFVDDPVTRLHPDELSHRRGVRFLAERT